MSQLYMLDTNTVSYVVKRASLAARARISRLPTGSVVSISAITEGEIWYGLDRIGGGGKLRNAILEFLSGIKALPWGSQEAAVYGSFRSSQEATGRSLGPLDTQIAAHAIAVGAVLVSSDGAFRHAAGLPGLEDWATDVMRRGP